MAAPPPDDAAHLQLVPFFRTILADLHQIRQEIRELREHVHVGPYRPPPPPARRPSRLIMEDGVRRVNTSLFFDMRNGGVADFIADGSTVSPQTGLPRRLVQRSSRAPFANPECFNCGSNEHRMARCLWVPEGHPEGCTICNQVSHLVDTCDIFRRMPLERKIRVLIHDRRGLPPLKTQSSWYEWFCLWLENPLPRNGSRIALPTGFPWTKQFAQDLLLNFNYARLLQEEFDYHNDVNRLPQDPATRDMAAVIRIFSSVEGDLI